MIKINNILKEFSPHSDIWVWSNPVKAQENAYKYLGKDADLFKSDRKNKKYMIYDPHLNKMISFGQMGYEDFTKHQCEFRRENYLKRTANMKGDWKSNPYSANNLARHILW
jgi:hypothetical protein